MPARHYGPEKALEDLFSVARALPAAQQVAEERAQKKRKSDPQALKRTQLSTHGGHD